MENLALCSGSEHSCPCHLGVPLNTSADSTAPGGAVGLPQCQHSPFHPSFLPSLSPGAPLHPDPHTSGPSSTFSLHYQKAEAPKGLSGRQCNRQRKDSHPCRRLQDRDRCPHTTWTRTQLNTTVISREMFPSSISGPPLAPSHRQHGDQNYRQGEKARPEGGLAVRAGAVRQEKEEKGQMAEDSGKGTLFDERDPVLRRAALPWEPSAGSAR